MSIDVRTAIAKQAGLRDDRERGRSGPPRSTLAQWFSRLAIQLPVGMAAAVLAVYGMSRLPLSWWALLLGCVAALALGCRVFVTDVCDGLLQDGS